MKCKNCDVELKKVAVNVMGAKSKVISYQCSKCNYFEFEPVSSQKVIGALKESILLL